MVVLLFDPICYGIGLVNIPTAQTSAEAIGEAVALLSQRTGAEPGKIQGLIGPSMGPCCRTFPDAARNRTVSRTRGTWRAAP